MNFPKIMRDIMFKIIWKKILIDLLMFFEEHY